MLPATLPCITWGDRHSSPATLAAFQLPVPALARPLPWYLPEGFRLYKRKSVCWQGSGMCCKGLVPTCLVVGSWASSSEGCRDNSSHPRGQDLTSEETYLPGRQAPARGFQHHTHSGGLPQKLQRRQPAHPWPWGNLQRYSQFPPRAGKIGDPN